MDSHEVRREWAQRSGAYSPAYYAHHGADARSEAVRSRLDEYIGRDASILEVGCGMGRHLAHLRDAGYADLTGIEVNAEAFDVLAEEYPDLAAEGTFYCAAIEAVIRDFPDDHFDAVYSVETLQHIHPDHEWVFEELARVAGDLVVTAENEGEDDGETVNYVDGDFPLYYRDWDAVFTDFGFEEVDAETGKRDTFRAFRP